MNEILGGICYAQSGARSDRADWQSLQSHEYKVGEMAAAFAAAFGAEQIARYTGQLHDLGKYTLEFNARLHGGSASSDVTTCTSRPARTAV